MVENDTEIRKLKDINAQLLSEKLAALNEVSSLQKSIIAKNKQIRQIMEKDAEISKLKDINAQLLSEKLVAVNYISTLEKSIVVENTIAAGEKWNTVESLLKDLEDGPRLLF